MSSDKVAASNGELEPHIVTKFVTRADHFPPPPIPKKTWKAPTTRSSCFVSCFNTKSCEGPFRSKRQLLSLGCGHARGESEIALHAPCHNKERKTQNEGSTKSFPFQIVNETKQHLLMVCVCMWIPHLFGPLSFFVDSRTSKGQTKKCHHCRFSKSSSMDITRESLNDYRSSSVWLHHCAVCCSPICVGNVEILNARTRRRRRRREWW